VTGTTEEILVSGDLSMYKWRRDDNRKGKGMSYRLIISLSVIALLSTASVSQAQWEDKVGRTLFQNAIFPCAAGPGKVAFLRLDEKIPGMPMEMYLGDVKTKTEIRALPGVDFKEMPQFAYAWSPDGTEFVKPEKSDGCWELFRYKTGSRTGEKLTNLIQYREKMTQEQMDQNDVSEDMLLSISEIAYSPSGKRLVFSMNRYTKNAIWWHEISSGRTRQGTPERIGYYGSMFPDDDHLCYTDPIIKEGITTYSGEISDDRRR
jgi:hypothetical protein